MSFPSSTLSGSLYGSSPEAIRGFWPDMSEKHDGSRLSSKYSGPRKVVHGYGINNSSTAPSPDPSTPSFSCSPPSFLSADDWWRKNPDGRHPAACLHEASASTRGSGPSHYIGDKLFDFNGCHSEGQLEKEYAYHDTPTSKGFNGGVPVYVMMPLDSVTCNNTLNRPKAMNASLRALKTAGVEGIMLDIWWGVVEKEGPGHYNWSGYRELMDMARKYSLKVQAVMSFHGCGGNVGDSCWIPLPAWVAEEIDMNSDLVYTDKDGRRNYEYLSLGCDTLPVLKGRSPVQAYTDFMRSFRDEFKDYLGEVVVEIQVGLGPAGELRYPSYPESNSTWQFPGIGEFQCYDKYMEASLKACAESVGQPDWGNGGPHDAGHYKQFPDETGFFHREGAWSTQYGRFFLEWYSGLLLEHGERILTAAAGLFRGTGSKLSGKVAGIHWHYGTRSHPAELTAGYFNTRTRDGYISIARMFGRHGVTLNFTCFEMKDEEQYPSSALCSPEGLLKQVTLAARQANVSLAGENALLRFDEGAHHQIIRNSRLADDSNACNEVAYEPMCSFTFLRMNEQLFQSDNWHRFVQFVRQMAEGRTFLPGEDKHHDMESQVHAMRPLIQEAEAALVGK